jgi:4-hydroxy-tetrahydrodipicolinate reductase
MGSLILGLAEKQGLEPVAAIDREGHPDLGKEIRPGLKISSDLGAALPGCDVVIDFSTPDSTLQTAKLMAKSKKALVIGTTGLSKSQVADLDSLCAEIPWILSPNMSLGVALMAKVVREMASALGDDYEIEVIETHHHRKVDAPSGTALMLVKEMVDARGWSWEESVCYGRQGKTGPRPAQSIGVHALRGGEAIGEHRVFFLGQGEVLEVAHRADSRDTFALGALQAGLFLIGKKPGRYQIADVVLGR